METQVKMDQGAKDAQVFAALNLDTERNKEKDSLRRKALGSLVQEAEEEEDRSLFSRSLFALSDASPENVTEIDRYSIENPEVQQSILDARLSDDLGGVTEALRQGVFAPLARTGVTYLGMGLKALKAIEGQAMSYVPGMEQSAIETERKEMEDIAKEVKKRREFITDNYGYDHKGKDPLATFGFGKDNEFDPQGSMVYVAEGVFESLPLVISAAFNPLASTPLLFAYGTSLSQDESVGEEWYESMSPAQKMGYNSAFGALEALPEWAGGKILNRALRKYAVGKLSEEAFQRTVKDYAVGAFRALGLDAGTNAGTEAVTGFGQELLSQVAKGEPIDIYRALRQAGNGALIGLPAGVLYGLPGSSTDFVSVANGVGRDFNMYRARKDIERLHRKLEDPNLTKEQQIIYRNELRDAIKRRTEISIENQELLQEIGRDNPDALNDIANTDLQIQSLLIKASNNMRNGQPIDKKLHAKYASQLRSLKVAYSDLVAPYELQSIGKARDKVDQGTQVTEDINVEGVTPDDYIQSNQESQDARELGEAAKATESVFGGRIKVVMHDGSYANAVKSLDPKNPIKGEESGRLIKNPKTGKAEIHINTKNATRSDIAHEAFHGVFYEQFGQNKKIADRMASALTKAMSNSSRQDIALINNVEELISSYNKDVKAEEFLATVGGELTSTYSQLSQGGKRKFTNALVSFIDDVLKSVGIKGLSNFRQNLNSEKEVIDFLNKFNRAFNQNIEFEVDVLPESGPETRKQETLPPDATPDELADFERKTRQRKAEAKKKEAEKKRKAAETKERESVEDEIQKDEDLKDAERLQREDDIRAGKVEEDLTEEMQQELKFNREKQDNFETRQAKVQKRLDEVEGQRGRSSAMNVFRSYSDIYLSDFLKKFDTFKDSFSTKFIDKYYPVVKFQRELEKRTGKKLNIAQDVINALTLGDSKTAQRLEEFAEVREKLGDLMKEAKQDPETMGDLLRAIHSYEVNLKTPKDFDGEDWSGTPMSEVQEILAKYDLTVKDLKNMETLKEGLVSRGNKDLWNALDYFYENVTELTRVDLVAGQLASGGVRKTVTRDGKKYYQIVDPSDPSVIIKEFTKSKARTEAQARTARDKAWNKMQAWNRNYKFYVPLKGFAPVEADIAVDSDHTQEYERPEEIARRKRAEEAQKRPPGKSTEVKSTGIKQREGRKTQSFNPFVQALSDRGHVIVKRGKNETMLRLYDMIADPANKKAMEGYAEDLGKYSEKRFGPLSRVFDNENLITVFKRGQRHVMEFANKDIVSALDGSNVPWIAQYTQGIGGINRLMSATITMLDPEFVLRNFTRDVQSALVNLQGDDAQLILEGGDGDANNVTKSVMKNLLPAFRAIRTQEVTKRGLANVFKGFSKSKRKAAEARQEVVSKYYDEFKKMGAKTAWFYAPTPEQIAKDFEKALPNGNKPTKIAATAEQANQAQKKFLKVISGYNSSVENAVRLSAYVTAREGGVSPEKAAELAKNLTVNFNRSGAYGSIFNNLYLFFNAAMQGSAVALRVITAKRSRPRKIALGMSMVGALTTILNHLKWSDEEEDGTTVYENLPEWEKQTNVVITAGDKVFKIPLPYGYNVFYYAGVAAAETALGIQKPGQAMSNLMSTALGAFSPLNYPQSAEGMNFIIKSITPTGVLPFVNLYMNEDYYGSKIYTEPSIFDKTPLAKSYRAKPGTNPVSVVLAKGINAAGGGTADKPSFLDFQPEAIDYLVGYYTGGLGKFGLRSSKASRGIAKGLSETELSDPLTTIENFAENTDLSPKDIPFLRVFASAKNEFADYAKFKENEKIVDVLRDRKVLDKNDAKRNKRLKVQSLVMGKVLDKINSEQKKLYTSPLGIKKVTQLQAKGLKTISNVPIEDYLNALYKQRSQLQVQFNTLMNTKANKELKDVY